ncbi:MAG: dual specificity protein phosphatase family protein [Planctomycetaceae bacterium]|nr:dual specificity protein phosphatase family protein [Planctomycetaceae bacterium]
MTYSDQQNYLPPVPIEYSYEVIQDQLYAGEYPRNFDNRTTPAKIQRFIDFGITDFVDFTEEGELLPYTALLPKGIGHHRFPVPDPGPPQTLKQMHEIAAAIDRLVSDGKKVYVHCWGGINRTGVAVGAWLLYKGMTVTETMEEFERLWATNPKSAWEYPMIRRCKNLLTEYADRLQDGSEM